MWGDNHMTIEDIIRGESKNAEFQGESLSYVYFSGKSERHR